MSSTSNVNSLNELVEAIGRDGTELFYDVDTQNDFFPGGKLAIAGADSIRPNLARLTQYALQNRVRLFGSVDAHPVDSEEFPKEGEDADYKLTYPSHCIEGSPGAKNIVETYCDNQIIVPRTSITKISIPSDISRAKTLFGKDTFNVFAKERGNPHLALTLKELGITHATIYGVATEVCVYQAVMGFLAIDIDVSVVEDAIHGIDPERTEQAIGDMKARGANFITTADVLNKSYI